MCIIRLFSFFLLYYILLDVVVIKIVLSDFTSNLSYLYKCTNILVSNGHKTTGVIILICLFYIYFKVIRLLKKKKILLSEF